MSQRLTYSRTLSGQTPRWISYTPTLTNLTLGNGTMTAKYFREGKLVTVNFDINLGTTSSVSTSPQIGLPFNANNYVTTVAIVPNVFQISDYGVNAFLGFMDLGSTNVTLRYMYTPSDKVERGTITSTVPFTWGNQDCLSGCFSYEAA